MKCLNYLKTKSMTKNKNKIFENFSNMRTFDEWNDKKEEEFLKRGPHNLIFLCSLACKRFARLHINKNFSASLL